MAFMPLRVHKGPEMGPFLVPLRVLATLVCTLRDLWRGQEDEILLIVNMPFNGIYAILKGPERDTCDDATKTM